MTIFLSWLCWGACQEEVCLDPRFLCNLTPPRLTVELPREKKPVLLFDMQENRIYVYPYLEFKNDLSARSQGILQEQYAQAMTDDKIVVFVRDNDAKKLVSYSV